MRDKSHMESVERWAEFVRSHSREEWKKTVNKFINAVYQKSEDFYKRLEKTEEGREVLKRLREERNAGKKLVSINGDDKVRKRQKE